MITTITQLHSIKPVLRFYVGSNPACGVLQVYPSRHATSFKVYKTSIRRRINALKTLQQRHLSTGMMV